MGLTHWLTGWVRFRVVTPKGGERFLNCCTRAKIYIWRVRPGSKGITACVRAGQYAALRRPARQAKVRLQIQRKGGLPLKIAHLRHRPGLIAGFVLFWVALLALGQCFWTVEVTGCKNIPENELRQALAEQGVAPGVKKSGFSAKEVQTKMMEKFPQISWISVNNHGADVDVQLTEKDEQPPVADQNGWYHLRASENGIVVEMHVSAGSPVVKVGDGVIKNQLLVSAVVEDKEQKFMRLYHAAGTVIAETKHTLQVQVPFGLSQWQTCGQPAERRSLLVFGVQIPLSVELPPSGQLMRTGQQTAVRLCGKELPLSFLQEKLTPVRLATGKRSRAEVEKEAKQLLDSKEKTELSSASVTKRTDTVKADKNGVTVTRQLVCRENIAKEVKISQ